MAYCIMNDFSQNYYNVHACLNFILSKPIDLIDSFAIVILKDIYYKNNISMSFKVVYMIIIFNDYNFIQILQKGSFNIGCKCS